MKKGKVLLFGIAAFAVWSFEGCKKQTANPEENLPTVRLARVELGHTDEGIRYSVSLLPNRQADLSFKSAGIIDQIRMVRDNGGTLRPVTMGDPIQANEALARVRALDYQQKIDQSEAQLGTATAQHEDARAALELAEKNFGRADNLYRDQSLTKQDHDRALQQRDSAAAQLQQADAGIANAKAQLAQAQLALRDASLTAPFSGLVVSRRVELGDLVANSTTAFTVADISQVKANFTVPDTALSQVKPGRKLSIFLMGGQREVPAKITAISPSADPQSRVFTVELTAPNPSGELKPGMIGAVELQPVAQVEPHITVPLAALVQSKPEQGFAVFVVDEDTHLPRVHQRLVSIGDTVGSQVQILKGINVGSRVVTVGAQTLHDNDAVRVIE